MASEDSLSPASDSPEAEQDHMSRKWNWPGKKWPDVELVGEEPPPHRFWHWLIGVITAAVIGYIVTDLALPAIITFFGG